MVAPAGLTAVVANEVSIKAIRNSWDGLLHVVASIHAGRVCAIVALQRFGSAAQGDPVHRAADHLGKLLRTLFLCDYFSNVEFRRECIRCLTGANRFISCSARSTPARSHQSADGAATK
jgi:TnpA family transposase